MVSKRIPSTTDGQTNMPSVLRLILHMPMYREPDWPREAPKCDQHPLLPDRLDQIHIPIRHRPPLSHALTRVIFPLHALLIEG